MTDATASDFAATCQLSVQTSAVYGVLQAQEHGSSAWVQASRIYLLYARDVATKLRAFRLAPNGSPMVKDEQPKKPKSNLEKLKDRRQAMQVVRVDRSR